MKYYHGTTEEKLKVVYSQGLRIGAFITTDLSVAKHFAKLRSNYNLIKPVILVLELTKKQVTRARLDRSGRFEAQTLVVTYPKGVIVV
jgi:hypothetical protein